MENRAYFQLLNKALCEQGAGVPRLVIDLDTLDHNIARLKEGLKAVPQVRLVVKSLPSWRLLQYLMARLETRRLMVFHQPFLVELMNLLDEPADILLGKPMPIAAAADFFQKTTNESHQINWLIDTEARLNQYLELAQRLDRQLMINLEIDVGLHRGGFSEEAPLAAALQIIREHPEHLRWTGFMGYDPQIVKLPSFLGPVARHFKKVNSRYQRFIDLVQNAFPSLWREDLILNGAGSPTFLLHQAGGSSINEVAIGSALLKPTTFDIPQLSSFQAACWIAAPVLKKMIGTRLPGIGKLPDWLRHIFPHLQISYFIYGGYWKADYCYPPDIRLNTLFGPSTNQSMLNASGKFPLEVDDYVYLRPWQSEFVLLQFGPLCAYRNGALVENWPILTGQ